MFHINEKIPPFPPFNIRVQQLMFAFQNTRRTTSNYTAPHVVVLQNHTPRGLYPLHSFGPIPAPPSTRDSSRFANYRLFRFSPNFSHTVAECTVPAGHRRVACRSSITSNILVGRLASLYEFIPLMGVRVLGHQEAKFRRGDWRDDVFRTVGNLGK